MKTMKGTDGASLKNEARVVSPPNRGLVRRAHPARLSKKKKSLSHHTATDGRVHVEAKDSSSSSRRRLLLLSLASVASGAAVLAGNSPCLADEIADPSNAPEGVQDVRARGVQSSIDADANNPFIQDLLRKTEAKREERKRERLQDYYRRNFSDYFSFEMGNARGGNQGLSEETIEKIRQWQKDNGAQ